ncbi:MAG: STAS domain-containing protein [Acidimicrobiia bacterium]
MLGGTVTDDALMKTRLLQADGAAILAVTGEIDMSVKADFDAALHEAIDAGTHRVQVDLRGVDYLDSSACNCLVVAAQEASAKRVDFRVSHVSTRASQVLGITGLSELLHAPVLPTPSEG